MFPDPVKKALEAVGVSESSLDRVRLAQGFVGKASYVAGTALLVLIAVAAFLRDPVYLLVVAFLAVCIFGIFFCGSLWFSHRHPDLALLEGAELIRWRQIEMAAKGQPSIGQSPPQALGRAVE
jgi:hypothetical protein